jgi:hypothetical protein
MKDMDLAQAKDVLRRAQKMEEEMAPLILDLITPEMIPADISPRNKAKIVRLLSSMKADSLKHKKIVTHILAQL